MIIYIHKVQAEMISQRKTFEVDMSYQRLRRKDLKEVTFAAFDEKEYKSKNFNWFLNYFTNQFSVCTFARAFISGEDHVTYSVVFRRVFQTIERLSGRLVR